MEKCENKQTYVKAQQNAQNAQPNLDRAEKDYYTAAKGAAYYSKMQGAKFKQQAQKQVKDWNDYINPKWKDIENKILYYKGLYPYQDNVKVVYDNYKDKYSTLVYEVQNTTNKKNVNYRLAHFYNYNTSVVNSLLWWLKGIYWFFFVIMFVIFKIENKR